MRVELLKLFQFRNLKDVELTFRSSVTFVVGKNGQGKTNLLEALYLLSTGRSFRTNTKRELINWGAKESSIFGVVQQALGQVELGVVFHGGVRKLSLNGNTDISLSDYFGHLMCVSFHPGDLTLVQGSPAERRRFLDKHLVDFDPSTLRSIVNYNRALKNKNSLLRSGSCNRELLAPWNKILSDEAPRITDKREKFLQVLTKRAQQLYDQFSAGIEGDLKLSLERTIPPDSSSPDACFEFLMKNADRELRNSASIFGPHRDDIFISVGDRDSRAYSSQGQARSIVLSLKLAVVDVLEDQRGEAPLVLLDDVESELDRSRTEALLRLVFERPRQVILTGTDLGTRTLFEDQDYGVLDVANGIIKQLN